MNRKPFLVPFALATLLAVVSGCGRSGGETASAPIRAEAVPEPPSFEPVAPRPTPKPANVDPAPAVEEAPVPSVRRVGRLPRVESLQIWEVGQEGEASIYFKKCTAGVETIEQFSDGHFRVTYVITNRSDRSYEMFLDMRSSYMADPDGETYEPIGREYQDNHNTYYGRILRAGTKFRYWEDYPAPKRPTRTFKVGVLHENQFGSTQADAFRPFTIELTEPIGPIKPRRNGEAQGRGEEPSEGATLDRPRPEGEGITKKAAPSAEGETAGLSKGRETILALKSGGVAEAAKQAETGKTPGRARNDQAKSGVTEAAKEPPQPTKEQLIKAMHAVIDKGQRFDGDLRTKDKNHDMARIIFEKCYGDTAHLQARMYSQRFSSTSFTLKGKLIEDGEAPSGLAFDLKGPGVVMYRFTLKGEDLVATDSDGRTYLFHPVR